MMTWIESLANDGDWRFGDFNPLLDAIVCFDGEIHIRLGVGLWHETGIYTRRVWE